jgi:hypothetical protein
MHYTHLVRDNLRNLVEPGEQQVRAAPVVSGRASLIC